MNLEALKIDPAEYKRQTGRTTRMMEDAKLAASRGKAVVVIFKDERDAARWRDLYQDVPGLSVIPMKAKMPELDWANLKLTSGPYANHQVFFDHDTIYCYQLKDLFNAWSKYDRPMDQSPYTTQPSFAAVGT